MSVALLLAAASASSSGWFQLDASAAARLAAGKAQLDELLAGSKAPGARGTQCWRDAVGALEGGCKALDDERQSRLAVAFANCHFLKSGLRAYDCADDVPLASCTAQMATEHNGMPFTVYTTFYTHAESMCFYIQAAAFQSRTEAAVSSLHSAVESASGALAHVEASASRMGAALGELRAEEAGRFEETTGKLHGLAALAGTSVEAMARLHGVQEAFAARQSVVLSQIGSLLDFHAALLGEFFDVKAILFYTATVILAMLLSSTKRTAPLRLPVFAVLSANWTLERALALSADLSDPAAIAQLHARLWALRRFALGCAACVGVRAMWRHVDAEVAVRNEVRALAVEVRRQSSEVLEAFERCRAASLSPPVLTARQGGVGDSGAVCAVPADPLSAAKADGSPVETLVSRSPVVAVPFALARESGKRCAGADRPRSAARRKSAGRARRESSGAAAGAGTSPARKRRASVERARTPAAADAHGGVQVRETRSSAAKAARRAAL